MSRGEIELPPKSKDAPSSMASVLAKVAKTYDLRAGSLDMVADRVEAISTGNLAIDDILGVNGLPIGRSVELYGLPSSGKTTTGLQAAAQLQKAIIESGRDEYIVYSDFEHALDRDYAVQLGLNLSHPSFVFTQPDNFEQGANAVLEMIQTGQVRLAIWDSVAAMTPANMLGEEVGKASVALQARLMSDFLKKLNPLLHSERCCGVFLNHEMEVMDMGGPRRPGLPPRRSTPGGRALKYYASVRVEYRPIEAIKGTAQDPLTATEVNRIEGYTVKVKVVKNKVAPPMREAMVKVRFGRGFDNGWTALQILTAHGRIKSSSGYYYFNAVPELVTPDMGRSPNGRPYLRSESGVLDYMDAHPEWRDLLVSTAREQLASGQSVSPSDPGGLGPVPSLLGSSAAPALGEQSGVDE
jgi:recombination protein RecA